MSLVETKGGSSYVTTRTLAGPRDYVTALGLKYRTKVYLISSNVLSRRKIKLNRNERDTEPTTEETHAGTQDAATVYLL